MMFVFEKTNEMCVDLLESQYKQVSSKENIEKTLLKNEAIGFNIKLTDEIIGFAMIRKYEEGGFFLWDYAIDYKYQNKKYGTNALKSFIKYLEEHYGANEVSTTYIYGNEIAAHVYENVGFVETDVVDEDDIHEVNMLLLVDNLKL